MQSLRHARTLVRLVLAWFVLSMVVAVASPLVRSQAMELICSGTGVMKIMVKADDGTTQPSGPSLDCPLCAHVGAPPTIVKASAEQPHPLSHALRPIIAAHIAWVTAAPLPARGPPAHS